MATAAQVALNRFVLNGRPFNGGGATISTTKNRFFTDGSPYNVPLDASGGQNLTINYAVTGVANLTRQAQLKRSYAVTAVLASLRTLVLQARNYTVTANLDTVVQVRKVLSYSVSCVLTLLKTLDLIPKYVATAVLTIVRATTILRTSQAAGGASLLRTAIFPRSYSCQATEQLVRKPILACAYLASAAAQSIAIYAVIVSYMASSASALVRSASIQRSYVTSIQAQLVRLSYLVRTCVCSSTSGILRISQLSRLCLTTAVSATQAVMGKTLNYVVACASTLVRTATIRRSYLAYGQSSIQRATHLIHTFICASGFGILRVLQISRSSLITVMSAARTMVRKTIIYVAYGVLSTEHARALVQLYAAAAGASVRRAASLQRRFVSIVAHATLRLCSKHLGYVVAITPITEVIREIEGGVRMLVSKARGLMGSLGARLRGLAASDRQVDSTSSARGHEQTSSDRKVDAEATDRQTDLPGG